MGKSSDVVWHDKTVERAQREERNGHKGVVLWFTGLSGAGKSTLANAVEKQLFAAGCQSFVFDGDNVRHGLCSDLGFSGEDRAENVRRIGEMTHLFAEAGIIAMAAFISAFRRDRRQVRALMPEGDFIEVYCQCSLQTCEARDVKGLYAKARAGIIKNYTGISSPYEEPESPEIMVDTDTQTLEESVEIIISYLRERDFIRNKSVVTK